MPTFSPDGKPRTILECLSSDDCDYLTLAEACGVMDKETRRNAIWHIIGGLLAVELIGGRRARYYILPAGRQALNALRAGNPITIDPVSKSVRLFA